MTYRADTDEEMIPRFSGPKDYQNPKDQSRLKKQLIEIRTLMLDGAWRTVKEIKEKLGYEENSIQAQLRNLRKPEYGGWIVYRKRNDLGVSEYQVKLPVKKPVLQAEMFSPAQVTDYQNFLD